MNCGRHLVTKGVIINFFFAENNIQNTWQGQDVTITTFSKKQ